MLAALPGDARGHNARMTETYPRQAARTRRFTCGAPSRFTVSPDGARVTYVRSLAGDDPVGRLWVLEVADGSERLVADPAALGADESELPDAERARRERMRVTSAGIVGYSTDRDVTRAAFALAGCLYVTDLLDDAPARLLDDSGEVVDPRLSPDGAQVAYVRAGAVHLAAWDGGTRLLVGPEGPDVTYGLADFIAAEELDRAQGLWWAPSSDALLVQRTDESPVATWWIADPVHPARQPRPHRYSAAGTANADVSLHLVRLDGTKAEIAWDHEEFCYLADVHWSPYGDPLVVLLDRPQRRRAVLAVDDGTAAGRTVVEHTDPHWVDSAPGRVQWHPDGRLLAIEVRGDRYALTADGVAYPGEKDVLGILDVSPDSILLRVQSEPAATQVVALVGGDARPLDGTRGIQTAVRGGPTTVLVTADLEQTQTRFSVVTGTERLPITSHAQAPVLTPVVHELRGEQSIAVLFPTGHVSGSSRLPVVMSPYGGPHHAEVVASLGRYGEDQWWADQGFVVVVADGRGTPGRGPAYERVVAGDLATPALEDQVAALQAVAAAYPDDVDTTRVGIRGWSFGGFLSALAVLRRPDVFHAAVAGAPVTDQRLYDTAYTERYLGLPQENPAAYEGSSLIADAPSLRRPLLLIHGMTDDNVVVAHTLALSGALTAAGRPHQVLPLSGVTHFTPDEVIAENRLLLELDFLRTHLRPGD